MDIDINDYGILKSFYGSEEERNALTTVADQIYGKIGKIGIPDGAGKNPEDWFKAQLTAHALLFEHWRFTKAVWEMTWGQVARWQNNLKETRENINNLGFVWEKYYYKWLDVSDNLRGELAPHGARWLYLYTFSQEDTIFIQFNYTDKDDEKYLSCASKSKINSEKLSEWQPCENHSYKYGVKVTKDGNFIEKLQAAAKGVAEMLYVSDGIS